MRWHNGVFIADQPGGVIGSIERRTVKRIFLDLLDKITEEGRFVSDSNRAPNYAPKIFAMRPDRDGFKKTDFERAMQTLFAEKEIRLGSHKGTDRKSYACIVRAAPECSAGGAGGSS
ncbi:MAG TPA: hypothetical protein VHT21_17620 [Stellaceae bacterium]|jgi:hypothetical protein|nr:hypothetical protein [Stellaceae bacterium]